MSEPTNPVKKLVVYQGIRLDRDGKRSYVYEKLDTAGELTGKPGWYIKLFMKGFDRVGTMYEVTFEGDTSTYWTSGPNGPEYKGFFQSQIVIRHWKLEHEAALTKEAQNKLQRKDMNRDILADMTMEQLRGLYKNAAGVTRRAILANMIAYLLD